MSVGPLSRVQLLDLEALLRRPPSQVTAANSIIDPFVRASEAHPATTSGGDGKGGNSGTGGGAASAAAGGGAGSSSQLAPAAAGGSSGTLAPRSPALRAANSFSGAQAPVSGDKALKFRWGWQLGDAALYFTWLAFAPARCGQCGAVNGGLLPSATDEYQCTLCHASLGHVPSRDIVEEIANENEDRASDDDERDDDAGGAGGGALGDVSIVQTVQLLLLILEGAGMGLPVSAYPGILRAATTVSHLLLLPDLDPEHHNVVRCAALYVACSVLAPARLSFPTLQRVSNCGLQWQDCLAAAAAVGTTLEDFFDHPVAHTRNLMADLARHAQATPSSRLWDPTRTPGLTADLDELKQAARPERLSPDHTAAIVVVELCRRHEDKAAAILEKWYDALVAAAPKFASLRQQPQLISFPTNDSPLLSVLLGYLAHHFDMHPVEIARQVTASGLFSGPTKADITLQNSLSCGLYPIPLTTRNSPAESPWEPVFRALNSSDRVILNALLAALSASPSAAHELPETTKTLQAILAKHGAVATFTANYCLRIMDDAEAQYNGDYFCSSVTPDGASYVHFTKPLSVRYRAKTLVVYLNDPHTHPSARRHTSQLQSIVIPPTRMGLEGPSAKLIIDAVASNQGVERWGEAVRRLSIRADLRRRMRAAANHVARATTLLDTNVVHSRIPADAWSDVGQLRVAPSVERSYAQCSLLQDLPATAMHLAATDVVIASNAAHLQHVVEAMPHVASPIPTPQLPPGSSPKGRAAAAATPSGTVPSGDSPASDAKKGGATVLKGRPGVPPLVLPPSMTNTGDGKKTLQDEGRTSSSAAAAAAKPDAGGKTAQSLRWSSFGLQNAHVLRGLVRHGCDRLVRLRRRRDEGREGDVESFVGNLEMARRTPLQPPPRLM